MKLRDFLLFFVNYKEFEITSNLSREEVVQKIEDNIGQEKEFVFSIFNTQKEVKMFSGEVSKVNYTFKIKQNTNFSKESPPIIIGTINELNGGSKIKIIIKHDFVYIVFSILIHFFLLVLFLAAYFKNREGSNNDKLIIFLIVILVVFYLIRLTFFKIKANKIKHLMQKVVN